jgi:hypothetical protein
MFRAAARVATPAVLLAVRAALGVDPRRVRPIEATGRLRAPILVLTGAEGMKTTREESGARFAQANPPKSYWETWARRTSILRTPAVQPIRSLCSVVSIRLCAAAACETFLAYECRELGRAGAREETRHFRT